MAKTIKARDVQFAIFFSIFSARNILFAYFSIVILTALPFFRQTSTIVQIMVISASAIFFGCYRRISSRPLFDKSDYTKQFCQQYVQNNSSVTLQNAIAFAFVGYYVLNYSEHKISVADFLKVPSYILGYIATANQITAQVEAVKGRTPFFTFKTSTQSFEVSKFDLVGSIMALTPFVGFIATEHWLLNNLIAFSITVYLIQNVRMSSTKVGFLVMICLFLYDVFVLRFNPDPISGVLMRADIPLKLYFPSRLADDVSGLSALGLEDIVVPGCFVALCLEMDLDRIIDLIFVQKKYMTKQECTFFNWNFVAYAVGLVTTYEVLMALRTAQPTFMYVVPSCLLTLLLTGIIQKNLKGVLFYDFVAEKRKQYDFFTKQLESAKKEKEKDQ